ncbi:hypothetical protein NC652_003418 [Populus alba x Populus x berolinensis]|nr:hypothetical protein NC652_003418 [Populus alba x Populus x berolinensis]
MGNRARLSLFLVLFVYLHRLRKAAGRAAAAAHVRFFNGFLGSSTTLAVSTKCRWPFSGVVDYSTSEVAGGGRAHKTWTPQFEPKSGLVGDQFMWSSSTETVETGESC